MHAAIILAAIRPCRQEGLTKSILMNVTMGTVERKGAVNFSQSFFFFCVQARRAYVQMLMGVISPIPLLWCNTLEVFRLQLTLRLLQPPIPPHVVIWR